jgi:hypothetical protein
MIIISVAPVSAEVVWDHELTDNADDVISPIEPNIKLSDKGQIDILSASATGDGDDLNITLTLAGARSTEDTIYRVIIVCDGDDAKTYTFSYLPFAGFGIEGPSLFDDDPEVHISADAKNISWIIPKDLVSATEKVEVTRAEAEIHAGFSNYVDSAPDEGTGGNGGNGGGGSDDPINVRVDIEFKKVEQVRYTIEIVIEGEDAKGLRGEFDSDVDGTVTQGEYDQHIEFKQLEMVSWNSTSIKLNDRKHQSRSMTFELQGMVGSATSTSPVTQVVVVDVFFAEPVEAGTHTYSDFLSTSDNGGDMWDVTADSLWTMSAPTGWKFKTDDWSSGLKTYLGAGGTTVTLSGLQMQSDWNTTMGVMNSFVITEKAPTDVDDESPGFGVAITMAGLLTVMMLAVAYRRKR